MVEKDVVHVFYLVEVIFNRILATDQFFERVLSKQNMWNLHENIFL